MDGNALFFLIFAVLGGLALFILGMSIMSDGLRVAAGPGLRTLLSKATANRFAGLALGTLLGFLVHSSAASVMLVGFLNAGLMSLAQAVAPKADIVLMHAFDVPFESRLRLANVSEDIINHYRVVARQKAQKDLLALREQAGLSTGKTRFVVVHGDASQGVLEQEQAFDCDLIVMGKHGKNLLEELIVGSVTKKVLAESQCDVLVSIHA